MGQVRAQTTGKHPGSLGSRLHRIPHALPCISSETMTDSIARLPQFTLAYRQCHHPEVFDLGGLGTPYGHSSGSRELYLNYPLSNPHGI